MTRLQAPTTQVIEDDENLNVVIREVESPPGFTKIGDSFRDGAVRFLEGTRSVRSRSIRKALSPGDVCIGPVHKRDRVLSLPLTAQPLIADVKDEDVLAENASWSAVELSSTRRIAYKMLQTVMRSLCMVYDVPF